MKVDKFVWEGGRMLMTLTLTMVLTLFLYFSWGFFCLLSVLLQKILVSFTNFFSSFKFFFIFLIIISFDFFIKKKNYEKYFLIFLIKIFFIKIFFIRIFSMRIRTNLLIVSNIIRNFFFLS